MAIAITLKDYLENSGIEYDLITHDYTSTCIRSAGKAHVSGEDTAKAVLLHDGINYIVAVLPATHRVQLGKLHKQFNRYMTLATEAELHELFDDCSIGAIPPIGNAYGVEVIIDSHLDNCDDIYFEAGDHTDLVHVSGLDFRHLMEDAYHCSISKHV